MGREGEASASGSPGLGAAAPSSSRRNEALSKLASCRLSSRSRPQRGASSRQQAPVDPPPAKIVKQLAWICQECQNECVPIRPESRCLCGHRLKEHNKGGDSAPFKCTSKNGRCPCRKFFLIVAEGSWALRCRCKHKHTDHDPVSHKCNKAGCKGCSGFDSPWVCNCDHPWSSHKHVLVSREVMSIQAMIARAQAQKPAQPTAQITEIAEIDPSQLVTEVNRFDLINRGRD